MEQKTRCFWVRQDSPLYCAYHDEERGTPIHDDQEMYGLFLLELFQAGLSWITLLKKREEASAMTSEAGNLRSARMLSISRPTLPVAPTTATR